MILHDHLFDTGKGSGRRLVSQLCDASLISQSPSEVCSKCYEANPQAVWLAWLKCTNTENHRHTGTVTVVVRREQGARGTYERRLVSVKPPCQFTELEDVKLCSRRDKCACMNAHSNEELFYWQWQMARKTIFEKVSYFFHPNHTVTVCVLILFLVF